MKKLFKSYTFTFNKNETKLITNFCKQAINQMSTDSRFAPDIKAYSSIMEKLQTADEEVKFTKDESRRLTLQLRENAKQIKIKAGSSWFLMRWIYNSLYNQYSTLLKDHFDNI